MQKEKNMQQLGRRNTCTPTGAAPARGNCDLPLNREETLGVVDSKTLPNNSEEHQHSGKSGQDLRVPVLNMRGEPLMPTTPRKARKQLEEGKAKVVSRTLFVIQLLYATGEAKQDVTLGIDAGYTKVGYSAITAGDELMAGELELRRDIKRLLEKRSAYRVDRRNRLWYREARFNNRGGKEKGWLPPSLEHKLRSHIQQIEQIKQLLPVTKIVVEVASFDTQKMQKPEIRGVEYQQGELQGYEVREYLLEKWGRACAYCGKRGTPLDIEHIIPKSRGGSDRVSNLTISCHECNQRKGNQTAEEFGHPGIQGRAEKSLMATAFMNSIRWRIVNHFNCCWTYGYITKYHRIRLGLDKSHINDAFIIAGGNTNQKRVPAHHISKQVRRQNRSLYKANLLKGGRRKRNTVKEVRGFRRFDKVLYGKIECFIFGLRTRGYFDLRDIGGNKIGTSVNHKKLKLVERARGKIQEVKKGEFPHPTCVAVPFA